MGSRGAKDVSGPCENIDVDSGGGNIEAYYQDDQVTLLHGDALGIASRMESGSADCIVTSPPYYGLRDYGVDGQYGLEETPAQYIEKLRAVFSELRRVLVNDGTLWLNIGDTYNAYNGNRGEGGKLNSGDKHSMLAKTPSGHGLTDKALPNKSLLGIPWRLAIALQEDGWVLRNSIIWHKPNGKPGGGKDRFANRHENVFMFSKSQKYYFDAQYRLDGDVWRIPVSSSKRDHIAVMPLGLAERCILAGSREGGLVVDPFSGSGTTGLAAIESGRDYTGIDISAAYLDSSIAAGLGFAEAAA